MNFYGITVKTNEIPCSLLDTRLIELHCKHVFNESFLFQKVLRESLKIGYNYCKWGSNSGNVNFEYHIKRIMQMEQEYYNHALRIVLIKYAFSDKIIAWTDNLH